MSFSFSFLLSFVSIFQLLQCVSHFPPFSVFLAIFQVLFCEFLISFVLLPSSRSYSVHFFNLFQCFSIYSMSYSVFLIFHVFRFSHHTAGPTVCISHFPCFSVFLAIFQILPWFSHFPRLSVFLTYSRSYIACFSFSTCYRFLAILQVLQWAFLIF